MGLETEYAFTALRPDGEALPRERAVMKLVSKVGREQPSVSGPGAGSYFLGNGSRLYVDCGLHPELGTPECTNPWDLVRYVKAGDLILGRAAEKLESEESRMSEALLFRCNVDYSGTGSTWGCHESYMHRADPQLLSKQTIPHLVSRIVFSGAGGFDPFTPGLRFTLSARAPHMTKVVSGCSTHDRGIFHTKNEPLCDGGYHRLHLLCGDSLLSQRAMWLTAGSTALIVRLVELGDRPGDTVRMRSPLKALRAFADDPECKKKVRLARGGTANAIAIQRHYLECVEARAGSGSMPSWAPDVCRVWRETLDALERDPRELESTLDWAIKHALYRQRIQNAGLDWRLLPVWGSVLEKLNRARGQDRRLAVTFGVREILGGDSPIRELALDLEPELQRKGLSWDGLDAFLALRQELFEIDWRFAQLGATGIFDALDRSGVLDHRVPGVNRVERAVSFAPTGGRAQLRGRVIRRLARRDEAGFCDWNFVSNQTKNRTLDLSDPFETKEHWKIPPEPVDPPVRRRMRDVFQLIESMGL
jgi:hypothetical protein